MDGTIIFLGDAAVGKSSLVNALKNQEQEDCDVYNPTLGAEMSTIQLSSKHGSFETTVWDYCGNERFLTAHGKPFVHADICVLVASAGSASSFESLSLWHDEYLQSGYSGQSPPIFVVVLNKLDSEAREVSFESVVGWSSKEPFEPSVWLGELAKNFLPAPPVVETCCSDNRGIPTLHSTIADRLALKKSLNAALKESVVPFASFGPSANFRCVMFGDAEHAKDLLLSESTKNVPDHLSEPLERETQTFASVNTGTTVLDVWAVPTTSTTQSLTCCRGAHVCIFALKLGISAMVHRIDVWKEIFLREAGLRDISSVSWIVVGCRVADYIADASLEAASYCSKNNCKFIELPEFASPDYISKCWGEIGDSELTNRDHLLLHRVGHQLEGFQTMEERRQEKLASRKANEHDSNEQPELTESHMARRPSAIAANTQSEIFQTQLAAVNSRIIGTECTFLKALEDKSAELAAENATLRNELAATNEKVEQQAETIYDLKLEMKLLWEELEKRK